MLSVLSTLGPKGVSELGWRELESASQAAAGLKQAGYSDHDVALWLRAFYTAGTRHEMLSVWRLFDEQGRGAVSAGHLENRLVDVYGEEARETICTLLHRSGGGRSVAAVAPASATEGESAGDRAMRRRSEATRASRASLEEADRARMVRHPRSAHWHLHSDHPASSPTNYHPASSPTNYHPASSPSILTQHHHPASSPSISTQHHHPASSPTLTNPPSHHPPSPTHPLTNPPSPTHPLITHTLTTSP